jgi:hypothetical protein
MKSSPDFRRWSAWRAQANAKARSTASVSIGRRLSSLCSAMTARRSLSSAHSASVRSAVRSL